VDAAFMSFQARSGIHAVWPGAGEASVTEVRFQCARRPVVARRERTTINDRRGGLGSPVTEAGRERRSTTGMGRARRRSPEINGIG
jgi:hypothetical protein